MRLITAGTFTLVIIVASAVSPQAQNSPAAPVTNAPGIPGWAYPVAAGVPGRKTTAPSSTFRTVPSA